MQLRQVKMEGHYKVIYKLIADNIQFYVLLQSSLMLRHLYSSTSSQVY